ncbi:MAG: hypothetical protein ACF8PG_12565 [Maioricimonas sp. JB045]|uniref:hypothetical protein n=1 Tax=Maioricimonas sp. JC845 TaxID=3232138 RepID=UPI003458F31E
MAGTRTAQDVLERHFLELRCGLLDLAAAFDRIDRSEDADAVRDDPRMDQLRKGLRILLDGGTDRAERIQLLFSDAYEEGWAE